MMSPNALAGTTMGKDFSMAATKPQIRHPHGKKLQPIKYASGVIDISRVGKRPKAGQKRDNSFRATKKKIKKGAIKRKESVDDQPSESLFYPFEDSVNASKETKANGRYTKMEKDYDSEDENSEIIQQSFNSLALQEETKIVNLPKESMDSLAGGQDRKISIIQAKAWEKSPVTKPMHNSDDQGGYQASTNYSHFMNKSSKKSGFKFSSGFFDFEDGEVKHWSKPKNREVFGILSEDEMEGVKEKIERSFHKNTRESSKRSQKRPFSSLAEDPKAEDDNSL